MTTKHVYSHPRILRISEVQKRIGFSKSYIYALQAKGIFPKSIKLAKGGRAAGFIETEIDDYVNERILSSRHPNHEQ